MKEFFGESLLLGSDAAKGLYETVKDLPIVDYHCHLNQALIASDAALTDIGELWLAGDHYKWRAMRLCGVEERFITGGATPKEKFMEYARIMPKLIGNPLYYFSHLELKMVCGICEPLCASNAERVYLAANEALKGQTVRSLLKKFRVEYLATTDDPSDDLKQHGAYDGITVAPTFRPDKYLAFDREAIARLAKASGVAIKTYAGLKKALAKQLDHFARNDCRISDHGFLDFPEFCDIEPTSAEQIFKTISDGSTYQDEMEAYQAQACQDALRGDLLSWLMREYKKRDMICQLHFSVVRNVNPAFADKPDYGFDIMTDVCDYAALTRLLASIPDSERPTVVLYSLNPAATIPLCNLSGAFRNVLVGAAWWFNDTKEGTKANLHALCEYAALGTNLGMLTDSRSFLSYSRFDFFRRILCDFVGTKVEDGEYPMDMAVELVRDICYANIKAALNHKK